MNYMCTTGLHQRYCDLIVLITFLLLFGIQWVSCIAISYILFREVDGLIALLVQFSIENREYTLHMELSDFLFNFISYSKILYYLIQVYMELSEWACVCVFVGEGGGRI